MLVQTEERKENQRRKEGGRECLKLTLKPKETHLAQQQGKPPQSHLWNKNEIQCTFFHLIATEKPVSPDMNSAVSTYFATYK